MNTYENREKTLAVFVPTYGKSLLIEDLLEGSLDLYAKYRIDLYIYDSSEDDETERITKTYQEKNKNLYYVRLPSDMHSNIKVYRIYQKYGWVRDYDYVWLCNDSLRAYEMVIQKLTGIIAVCDYDMLVMHPKTTDALEELVYTDINNFFVDNAWKLTRYGACILKTCTMLNGVDWKYLDGKYMVPDKVNFSHLCYYFEQIITLSDFKAISVFVELHGSEMKKYSSWRDSTFLVWLVYYVSAVNALPDVYINKTAAIKQHGLHTQIFLRENLLALRKDGILNKDVYKEYKREWATYSGRPLLMFFLYAMLPIKILSVYEFLVVHNTIKHYFALRRLERFCKKYEIIYLYGAGRVAKRYLGYLKKMDIRVQGIVVTGTDEHSQKKLNGLPIKSIDMLKDWENTGIVLGLNQFNALEVNEYLNEKRFTGGMFDEYIKG